MYRFKRGGDNAESLNSRHYPPCVFYSNTPAGREYRVLRRKHDMFIQKHILINSISFGLGKDCIGRDVSMDLYNVSESILHISFRSLEQEATYKNIRKDGSVWFEIGGVVADVLERVLKE